MLGCEKLTVIIGKNVGCSHSEKLFDISAYFTGGGKSCLNSVSGIARLCCNKHRNASGLNNKRAEGKSQRCVERVGKEGLDTLKAPCSDSRD